MKQVTRRDRVIRYDACRIILDYYLNKSEDYREKWAISADALAKRVA